MACQTVTTVLPAIPAMVVAVAVVGLLIHKLSYVVALLTIGLTVKVVVVAQGFTGKVQTEPVVLPTVVVVGEEAAALLADMAVEVVPVMRAPAALALRVVVAVGLGDTIVVFYCPVTPTMVGQPVLMVMVVMVQFVLFGPEILGNSLQQMLEIHKI
jgi:hypothetical protein